MLMNLLEALASLVLPAFELFELSFSSLIKSVFWVFACSRLSVFIEDIAPFSGDDASKT